jgi:hypothetical protein
MEDAESLDTETFVQLVPVETLEALGRFAREQQDDEVADMVEALALVARAEMR